MRKWLISAAFGVLSLVSCLAALANALQGAAPKTAVAIPLHGGFANSQNAKRILREFVEQKGGTLGNRLPPAAIEEARRAFRSEPTDQYAVSVLGLAEKERDKARRIMEASFALNRRPMISGAWLAEDAARRSDLAKSLYYYDLILRRENQASEDLLKRFVLLLRNPDAVPTFARFLKTPSPWHRKFWDLASLDKAAVVNAADVRKRLVDSGYRLAEGYDSILLSRLTEAGRYAEAWSLYQKLRPRVTSTAKGASADRPFNFAMEAQLAPFFWVLQEGNGELGGVIDKQRDSLQISIVGASSGEVARRLVLLDGGLYRPSLVVRGLPEAPEALSIQIDLACSDRTVSPLTRTVKIAKNGRVVGPLLPAPPQCPYVWMSLRIQNEGQDGTDFEITDFRLVRSEQGAQAVSFGQ
jgi:hypothetical protein